MHSISKQKLVYFAEQTQPASAVTAYLSPAAACRMAYLTTQHKTAALDCSSAAGAISDWNYWKLKTESPCVATFIRLEIL